MSIDDRNRWFPQTVWAEIGKLFNRYTTMTVILCEHDDDDDDDDHDTTRLRAVRRRNVTTPTTAEMNSEESILRFIVNKGAKSQPHVEGSTKKTRKCTAACVRTSKGDRCTGAADTAAVAAAAASFCCNDAMQKTYRSAQQHDRSSACNKTAADCRGQCPRTGKYVVNDNQQSTGTRSYRANEGQCTVAAAKCVANDHPKCTGTRSHRANEGQCTGANYNRCTDIGNYRANDGQCTGTGNYGANNSECNGCGCISASAAAVAAAACLGGSNAFGRGNTDTLVSTVYKWAKIAMDWTWDKTSYLLVAAVSFFLGIYICDLCLCTCEDAS
ncbi:hypothetical protein QTP88_007014 [Uroleucon formosanum]